MMSGQDERMTAHQGDLSDIRPMRRTGSATLTRWVPCCRVRREVQLPDHPAGLGRCSACGFSIDLCDYPRPERRAYLAQYTEEKSR
jgi:hypothetical protein